MNCSPLSSSALPLVALLVFAQPGEATAQARQRGSAPAEGQAVPRGRFGSAAEAPQPAPAAQPSAPPAEAPRAAQPAPRGPQGTAAPQRRVDLPSNNVAVPRTVPRTVPQVVVPRIETFRRNDHPAYRPDYRPVYPGGYYSQYRPDHHIYRPDYRYSRPYYVFRPRVRLGFSVWVGYPIAYPFHVHPYGYPYPYPYPYSYSYPNPYPLGTPPYPYPASAYQAPGAQAPAVGGLSFEIRPSDADVFVDGVYVGTVGQFSPDQPPLTLTPGRHRIEVRRPGYEVIVFDVDILPGQVIPYQGDLRRF